MRKYVSLLTVPSLLGALVFTGCSDDEPEDGGLGGAKAASGENGEDGSDAEPCSIDGNKLVCPDGSSFELSDLTGADGEDGSSLDCEVEDGVLTCDNGLSVVLDGGSDAVFAALASQAIATRPLSSMVAVVATGDKTMAEMVQERLDAYAKGTTAGNEPLEDTTTDTVRVLDGLAHNVVARWLDPLTTDLSEGAPHFGANADYSIYIGEGADFSADGTVYFKGESQQGWMWSNHEYISNGMPGLTNAPTGQHLTMAKWLKAHGILTNDVESNVWTQEEVNTYVNWYKKQLGGSWFKVIKVGNSWRVDRSAEGNKRFDATAETLSLVTGLDVSGDSQVVKGILGDCSGGLMPWGTVVTAEENVQDYYGDLETFWLSSNNYVDLSDPVYGAGGNIDLQSLFVPTTSGEFSVSTEEDADQPRDHYGFLVEMDPMAEPGVSYASGEGHQKLGAMGRARWENVTIKLEDGWTPADGQPITLYGGNDRRGGSIYKWVSKDNYTDGMTKAQVRDLMAEGTVYVANFAVLDNDTGRTVGGDFPRDEAGERGKGVWIELSLDNTSQEAPNAPTLGAGTSVADALKDDTWNKVGAYTSQEDVLKTMFTASMKLGVKELNRPEDLEWNPKNEVLYIAFTKHGARTGLDEDGVLYGDKATSEAQAPQRKDPAGAIFGLRELPGGEFEFWSVWEATKVGAPDVKGNGFDAAAVDNLMLDAQGNLWFGTDGNYGRNGTADALYYVDLDESHKAGAAGIVNPTYGYGYRIIAGPSDSEATGPSITPDGKTIFFNVQHPGESEPSTWPQSR